jgi:hypothetical protein
MQNLINHIIQEERKSWDMYLWAMSQHGNESEITDRWKTKWHTYSEMIEKFNLTAPTKNNLSTFKHKKYTTIKTCEL